MSKILVQTGFGFYQDAQGHIVSKAELPKGPHDLANGLTYVELNSRSELDQVEIYRDPAALEKAEIVRKIAGATRAIAIAELKKNGELPPDYKDL